MGLEKAFILAYASASDDKLALAGRLLADLAVGETLYLESGEPFLIEQIRAYRQSFENLCAGMTGELIVSGAEIPLAKGAIFYLSDSDDLI